tara:strand:+ start:343 stop:756 length:414 start_codon:yes stop_codon:yes gene_type:complete
MAGKARQEENKLLVKLSNVKPSNVFGEPFRITSVDDEGNARLEHVDVARIIKVFLRSVDRRTGQNLVVKSHDDSARARTIGAAVQSANKMVTLSVGDHRWLVTKMKELGWMAFPTDADMLLELFENGNKERGGIEEE